MTHDLKKKKIDVIQYFGKDIMVMEGKDYS